MLITLLFILLVTIFCLRGRVENIIIIFKGVHIGARSIIGGGSIVTKDIPSDCIAGGNPCKVLRYMKK